MIVTSLSYTNNGSDVDIFIDNIFFYSVLLDTLAYFKIYGNKEIRSDEKAEIVKYDVSSRLFKKALNYITIRPRSEHEIFIYLSNSIKKYTLSLKKLLEDDSNNIIINEVITKLKTLNYLNDEEFSKWLIGSRISTGSKSRKETIYDLMHKGVNSTQANEFVSEIYTIQDESELIGKLIDKKYPDIKEILKDNMKKKKMIGYFLRRGFDYGLIKEIIIEKTN